MKTKIPLLILLAATIGALAADAEKTDYIGQQFFPHGDSIEIKSVERMADSIVVKGDYNLVSGDSALLALYITATNNTGVSTRDGEKQTVTIAKGRGEFELVDPHPSPGLPHVSMYGEDRHPFATVYFGTKAEAAAEGKMDLSYNASGHDVDSAPPVVIKTIPEAGAKDVPPGEYEIQVTFSKDMADQSWSWSTAWENSTPEMVGKPHYTDGHRTCVLKVTLEPGKTYGFWLNSQKFHGFRDAQNHSAVPYLLTFATGGGGMQKNSATPVDLTAQYTTTASQFDQLEGFPAWKSVPRGTQVFEQVPLQIGGMFCLWGEGCAQRNPPFVFPEATTGIQVNRKFETLYVYHGSFYTSPAGTPVCDVVFHYEDGSTVTNEMLFGDDFLDWAVNVKGGTLISPTGSNSRLAWIGGSFSPDKIEPVSFCLTAVENPHPQLPVVSVDLYSRKSRTAAVIMAMTTGPSGLMQGKIASSESANTLSQKGWQLWQVHDYDGAAAKFREVVSASPSDANSWNGLGWALFNGGKTDDAIEPFQKAVALQPDHPAALNGLGQIYLSQRKYDDAEKYLLKAAPKASAAWYGLARLYLLEGKYANAEHWAQNIVDAGQADETAKKMLEAAQKKNLSEGLRLLLEPPAPDASGQSPTAAATAAAQAWLAGVDAGNYAQSWTDAAGYFQGAITQDKWVAAMQSVRAPLGQKQTRTVDSVVTETQMPGAPDGKYVVMQFKTGFAEKSSAVETVTFVLEKDGHWKADGYYIK